MTNTTRPTSTTRPLDAETPAPPAPPALTLAELREDVAELTGLAAEDVTDDEDLIGLGLDSIRIMTLVNRWQERGLRVTFAELLEQPTVAQWWALLGAQEGAVPVAPPRSEPVDVEATFPLTPVQHAYWIGRRDGQRLGGVGCHFYAEYDGTEVDPDRLERAVRALESRHPMLRSRFLEDGTQQVTRQGAWPGLTVHDLRKATDDEITAQLDKIWEELSHQRLDVAAGRVFDIQLTLLPEGATRLHVSVDLLVADVLSIQIILDDLARCYDDPESAPASPPAHFAQYLADQEHQRDQARSKARAYWQDRIEDLPAGPLVPLATAPEDVGRPRFTRLAAQLDASEWTALKQRARERGLTPAMVLATAFSEVLAAWSAQQRFLLNLPLFDRLPASGDTGTERMVADFTNLILLTVDASDSQPFTDRVRRVQTQLAADVAHAAYSGVEVLRDLGRSRPAEHITAPVVFASNLGGGDLVSAEFRRRFGDTARGISQTPQVWLDHQLSEQDGTLQYNWDAVEGLFCEGVVEAMFLAYQRLLKELVDSDAVWSEPVGDLLPTGQRAVREAVNATSGEVSGRLLHEGFTEWAEREPGRTALVCGDGREVSYGELARWASGVAGLLSESGIAPGDVVGVTVPKGPGQIAAVLGVLWAGCAYVPVGVEQPAQRRAQIHRKAGVTHVLTTDALSEELGATTGATVHAVDRLPADVPHPAPVRLADTETAYVIFTSGSTGEPKGVEVSHGAAVNTVEDVCERFEVGPQDRVLAVSALDFDLSVFDVFGLLGVGGAVVLVEEGERRDAVRWLELVDRYRVTVWNTVPALLDMLVTVAEGTSASRREREAGGLRLVLVSGDWVGLDLPGRVASWWGPECRFVALGGATEAAVWSNAYEVEVVREGWRSVPYGFPLRNQCFRVVDERGRDCPDWVAGELWIGGAGVAEGYRGDPELSRERFVQWEDRRWYRTGDMGRYWPDGTLEFLGRQDFQVKVRGHRIELGEIEAALEAHPLIDHAIATTSGDKGSRQLVAAVVPSLPSALRGPSLPDSSATDELDAAVRAVTASTLSEPAPGRSHATDELEAQLVETLLVSRVLAEADVASGARSLSAVARRLGVSETQRPLLRLWLEWLTERDVLSADGHEWVAGPRMADTGAPGRLERLYEECAGTPIAAPAAHLTHRASELVKLLRAELPATALLEEPELRPDFLAHSDVGTPRELDVIAQHIAALAAKLGRPVSVAELDSRGGHAAHWLLSRLGPEQLRYTALDSSSAMLQETAERCAGLPHLSSCERVPDQLVPEHLVQRFEIVLADNALHRHHDVTTGARTAVALLRPGGLLLIRERTRLTPLALLTAAPLERGYADLDDVRRARRSPLLAEKEWGELLTAAGLTDVMSATFDTNGMVLRARCLPGPALPDTAALRAWAADRLPSYMVPDQLAVVPALPLSANGKVNRQAVGALMARFQGGTVAHTPPRGPVEQLVAELWQELLNVPRVSRDDDFFALGGDSLLATRLVTRLRAAGAVDADLQRLFTAPVLAEFADGLRVGDGAAPPAPELTADPEHRYDPFPATDVQQAYLFGRHQDFTLGGVGAHYYAEFEHIALDLNRFEEAWNLLIARHDMLRTVFTADGTQRVLAEVPRFTVPLRTADEGQEQTLLDEMRAAMSHQVLDPLRWPVFDVRAVRAGARTRVAISLDNILLDGLSMMTLFAELERLYEDPDAALPPVRIRFRDYVLNAGPTDEERAVAQRYWTERLADLPPGPQLPLATDPRLIERPRFTRQSARLDADSWQTVKERAREHGLTPSTVLLACYGEVLSAWSSSSDLTLNLTQFDRREVHPDINNILGDFTSLLLVAYRPRAGDTWLDTARRLQEQVWRDLDHQQVSAVWVMRELAKASGGAQASMPVVFTSALGVGDELAGFGTERFADRVWGISQTPQVWLDQQVYESRGDLVMDWDAVEGLFCEGVVEAMFAAYQGLLTRLADSGAAWSEPVEDVLPEEQRAVREAVNATAGPVSGRLLHEGFAQWARRDPGRTALVCGDGSGVSYGELAHWASSVAGLLAEAGAQPGDAVGVTAPKGPGQIAAVLGVLWAGCTYVPVGVDQPARRRDRIYAKAGVRMVLTEAPSVVAQPPSGVRVLKNPDAGAGAGPVPAPTAEGIRPDSPAYVIFTSGSTGEPKGVEVSHTAAVNTLDDIGERFRVGPQDRVLAVSALDFDLSVFDIFGLLGVGGALVLIEEEERRDAARWLELVEQHRVTVWNTVPALLDMLVTVAEGPAASGAGGELRLVLVSGDWVGLDLPERVARWCGPDCRFVALGGATEAAVWSNACEVDTVPPSWHSIPYGFPLRNQRYRVVDERGRDCPTWVPGELWIGGTGVALGYRGDPGLTQERFVDHHGARWYRTGDIGRYWPDGTLEFLGRIDFQVKVRGHRIELGEVEAALEAHPLVDHAIATTTGDRTKRRLTAFLVTRDPALDTDELTAFLGERLAPGAIPSSVTVLDTFPLTANGKVDRTALAELAAQEQHGIDDSEPPVGPIETEFAAIWAELLATEHIGRHRNLFELGADSLLATRFVEIVRARHGIGLSVGQVFEGPTVAEFATAYTAHADHLEDELAEDGTI
ncbi:amino acid adenylation domain-containing protein [Streptomyces sp. NPDC050211]|uniref:non-ribosomal peptide synthetase n=1 Tax=Streptomyces sp. NPDC050211 TaxID=3154932 RepID=UPI003415E4E9